MTHVPFSPREKEVVDLTLAGKTSKQTARILGCSYRTVETHRTHIMNKLGANNFIEATRLIMEERYEMRFMLERLRAERRPDQATGNVVLLEAMRRQS